MMWVALALALLAANDGQRTKRAGDAKRADQGAENRCLEAEHERARVVAGLERRSLPVSDGARQCRWVIHRPLARFANRSRISAACAQQKLSLDEGKRKDAGDEARDDQHGCH